MSEYMMLLEHRNKVEHFLGWCRNEYYELCEESNNSESSQVYRRPLISDEDIVNEYIDSLKS